MADEQIKPRDPVAREAEASNPVHKPAEGVKRLRRRPVQAPHKPWWQNALVIVPALAFLLNLVTTGANFYIVRQNNIHEQVTELRSLVQRLNALPKEAAPPGASADTLASATAARQDSLNGEEMLLASQAADLIEQLPQRNVSTTAYVIVARALHDSGDLLRSSEFIARAASRPGSASERIVAARLYAGARFALGDAARGREWYDRALKLADETYAQAPALRAEHRLTTLVAWAQAEYSLGQCQQAGELAGRGIQEATATHNAQVEAQYRQYLAGLRTTYPQCQ